MLTRRALNLGVLSAALLRQEPARADTKITGRKRSRYFVVMLLSGGIDPIMSTDPKSPRDVERGVDIPFEQSEIIQVGDLRLGPLLKSLEPIAPGLAVINGVKRNVANHVAGVDVFNRMNQRPAPQNARDILELLSMTRDNQPLGMLSDDWLNELQPFLATAGTQDLATVQLALRSHAKNGPVAKAYARGADLLDRVRHATKFTLESWTTFPEPYLEQASASFQRALWMLENDLTCAISLQPAGISQVWDSHQHNVLGQQFWSSRYMPLIAKFLAGLKTRKNAYGPLDQTTTVVIASEVGRFPLLNGWNGKDHFSEAPVLLFGAGVKGGRAYGRTGRRMEAVDVSLQTGEALATGSRITMEDLGTTLLQWAGFNDPAAYGYRGKSLRFLEST